MSRLKIKLLPGITLLAVVLVAPAVSLASLNEAVVDRQNDLETVTQNETAETNAAVEQTTVKNWGGSPRFYSYRGNMWRVYFNQEDPDTGSSVYAKVLCIEDTKTKISGGKMKCGKCLPDEYRNEKGEWVQYKNPEERYVCVDWHGDDDANTTKPDAALGWLAGGLTKVVLAVTAVVRMIIELFVPSIEGALDWAFNMPPELKWIWSKLLNFSNTVLVLAAMAVVVLNLLGIQMSNYAFKTYAPKFIFAAIGANLSWVIASLVLDVGQIAYNVMLNINSSGTSALGIAYITGYDSFQELGKLAGGSTYSINEWMLFRGALFDLIILLFLIIPIVTIWGAFIVRYVMLMVEIAVAPLAYVGFAVKPDLFGKYWNTFLDHVFMPAKVAFFIAIGVLFKSAYAMMMMGKVGSGAGPVTVSQEQWAASSQGGSFVDSIIFFAVSAVCIFIATKAAISKTAYMDKAMGAITGLAKMWNKVPVGGMSWLAKKGFGATKGAVKLSGKGVGWAADKTGVTEKLRQAGAGTVGQHYRDTKAAAKELWNDETVKKARTKASGAGKWLMGQTGDLGRDIAQADSITGGAKMVWESWKGNMDDLEKEGQLNWAKRFANVGHVGDIATGGVLKGTGFSVGGIKASIQLKLDNEYSKHIRDEKYRDRLQYGTRQQLIAGLKENVADARKGDRYAMIAAEHHLEALKKHLGYMGVDEAEDVKKVWAEIIGNEKGKNPEQNIVRRSYAGISGDYLGQARADNVNFADIKHGADGQIEGFYRADKDGNISAMLDQLYKDEYKGMDLKTVYDGSRFSIKSSKGQPAPKVFERIAKGEAVLHPEFNINSAVLNNMSDPHQIALNEVPDGNIAAFAEMTEHRNLANIATLQRSMTDLDNSMRRTMNVELRNAMQEKHEAMAKLLEVYKDDGLMKKIDEGLRKITKADDEKAIDFAKRLSQEVNKIVADYEKKDAAGAVTDSVKDRMQAINAADAEIRKARKASTSSSSSSTTP